jgi:thymidylate synthase (FAD)
MEKGTKIWVLDKGYVTYVDHYGSDLRIVEAARVSYDSPSKGDEQDKKLLEFLFKNRHTSPFEQCAITFEIKLPLFVQGQLVRHRTQKLNQMSARYTEMPDEFYIPFSWRPQDKKNKQGSVDGDFWNPEYIYTIDHERDSSYSTVVENATDLLIKHCQDSYNLYKKLIKMGVAKEMARMHLPQNLYTKIYSCWDVHNLLHMFRLRLDPHAQWEIRKYAQVMYNIFKELFPWTHEAYQKYSWELKENQS